MSNQLTAQKTNKWLNFLSVFILVYFSNDTLLFGTNKNELFFWVHILVLAALLGFWLLKRTRVEAKSLSLFFVLILFNWLTMVISGDGFIKYAYHIFILFLALIIVTNIKLDDFIKSYNNVIFVLAIGSIAVFIINLFLASFATMFPQIVNDADAVFYYMGFGFANFPEYAAVPRMYGIFREPGVYMIFLFLAILFEILSDSQPSIKRSAVYILAMMLTFSTAAYILIAVSVVLMFVKLSSDKSNSRKTRIFKIFLVSILAITAVIFVIGIDVIFSTVFKKLYVDNASSAARLGSIEINLRMFYPKPVFGNGWAFVEENFPKLSFVYGYIDGGHNTNTLLKLLAIYGLPYFIIIGLNVFNFWKKVNRSLTLGIIVFGFWLVANSNEDLCVNVLTYILVFYGCSNLKKQDEAV